LTESTDRPTATEQDVPGVTTQVTQNDVGSAEDLAAAYEESLKAFEEGDIVDGYVVKVDRDEVLLDIGYKSEGVIPSRELSIKHDVDPNEVVSVGDIVEALVLQKEDKEGRLILSKKRAQYERAWGTIEAKKENDDRRRRIQRAALQAERLDVRDGPLRRLGPPLGPEEGHGELPAQGGRPGTRAVHRPRQPRPART
jgi:predicted RNA-binding protein with RPS1 domain